MLGIAYSKKSKKHPMTDIDRLCTSFDSKDQKRNIRLPPLYLFAISNVSDYIPSAKNLVRTRSTKRVEDNPLQLRTQLRRPIYTLNHLRTQVRHTRDT